MVPRLTTDRLLLREFRLADFEAFAANAMDPVARQYISPVADRRTAWREFTSMMGQWTITSAGWWGIELRDTGEFVGMVGAFIREHAPHDLELGWSIYRAFWRRGIASEAAKAARDWAFTARNAPRVVAHIASGNAASIRVSENLGMRYDREVDFYGGPCNFYVADRPG
jgi:RimJ/RimL family protein N-acetyltransferase